MSNRCSISFFRKMCTSHAVIDFKFRFRVRIRVGVRVKVKVKG